VFLSFHNEYENKGNVGVFGQLSGIGSCFAGNSSYIFQKVLSSMVGHGTSSKKHYVRLLLNLFCISLLKFPNSLKTQYPPQKFESALHQSIIKVHEEIIRKFFWK
jgi:hypothetical protein